MQHAILIIALGLGSSLALGGLSLGCSSASSPDIVFPESDVQRLGYSIGYQVGQDFQRQGIAIDAALFVEGAMHALAGTNQRFSPSQMHQALIQLDRRTSEERLAVP